MERLRCFDTIKFMAILMVCVTHFISIFNPHYFYLWNTSPTKYILEGISGNFGVCIMGVVMCYFAYKSKETNPIRYFFKRYSYFVVSGGVINVCYVMLGISDFSMGRTFLETMSLGSEIFPAFWCMRPFLLASFIAYLNGKFSYDNIYFLFIELAILWFVGWYRTFICLFGCFVPILLNRDIISDLFDKRIVQMISLMAIFLLIKRDECISTYVIDGISTVILLIVIVRGEKTKTKRPIGTARRRSKAMPWPSIIWDGLIIMVGESPKIIPKLRCGCRKPQSRDIAARSNFLRNSTRKERASGKILRRL